MQPKLKENPREWLKFTAVMAAAGIAIAALSWRRHLMSAPGFTTLATMLTLAVLICAVRPRLFRGFYRVGMTASFHVGQVMGRVLLSVVFLLVVTPLGLLLRLTGRDLLQLRREPSAVTYWRKAKPVGPLERQF